MVVILDAQLKSLNSNTIHRYCLLWKIDRVDGGRFRFTDHNTDVTFQGNTYGAAVGFGVSATQRESGLNEQNKEAAGIIVPEGVAGITNEELRGGKFRNAVVTEYIVDWQYPWLGEFYKTKYLIADMAFNGFHWKAELVGQAKYVRMPVGKIYNRNCRHNLGHSHHYKEGENVVMFESRCGFDLDGNMSSPNLPAQLENQTITSVDNLRKKFRVAITSAYVGETFRYGLVGFETGLNDGLWFEIATQSATGGGNDAKFMLFVDTPYNISDGSGDAGEWNETADLVTLIVGCDKTLETCKTKFGNNLNYGGYPDIVGVDRAILIPDTR